MVIKLKIRKILSCILIFSNWLSISAQSIGDSISIAKRYSDSYEYTKSITVCKAVIDKLSAYAEGYYDDEIEQILPVYTNALLHIGSYDLVDSILSPKRYARNFTLMNNRAAALGYLGKYDEAIELFQTAFTIPDLCVKQRAHIYQNLGFIQTELGEYHSAINNLQNAIENFDGIDALIAQSNLAMCYAYLKDYSKAIMLINSAINQLKSEFPTNVKDYAICLRKKAQIYSLFNMPNKAYGAYQQYFNLEKNYVANSLSNLSVPDRLNLWFKEKPLLSKCFLLENYAPEFLYEVAMFRRQTSLLGLRDIDNLLSRLATKPNDIRNLLTKNEVAIEFVSYTALDGKTWYAAIILPKTGKAKFVKLINEDFIYEPEVVGANSLINAIKRDDPFEKNLLYSDTVLADKIWSPIVAALSNHTSKIYFAPEGVFHFLGIENMPFTGKERFELHRVSSTASLPYAAQQSSRSGRALLIGGLDYSSMPQDSAAGSFSHEASNLLRQKVGDTNIFQYLPDTRSEVDSINAILGNADITYHIGEANLKNEMPDFDIIHIATHGYSLNLGIRKRPEFAADSLAYDISLNAAGLALSGANVASLYSDREDGILSAREICDLDLSNVDFVILSACQTAQGDITDEGAAGLVRGLKNAGAKTVLATLWSVDDKSTRLFMQEFYRLLNDGKTKHEAYSGAQQYLKDYVHSVPTWNFSPKTLSREGETQYNVTRYDTPYYWAPFIIIDDF